MSDPIAGEGAKALGSGFTLALNALDNLSNLDPRVKLAAQASIAVVRLLANIAARHGAAGIAEARRRLEELDQAGPQRVTDAEIAADDEALRAEIEGWYGKPRS